MSRDLSRSLVTAYFDDQTFGVTAEGLRESRDWSERRNIDRPDHAIAKDRPLFFVAESGWSLGGSVADRRLAIKRSRIPLLVQSLLHHAGLQSTKSGSLTSNEVSWVDELWNQLEKNRGASLLAAGSAQPLEVHQALHRLNEALGNVGATVRETAGSLLTSVQTLEDFAHDVRGGEVQSLFILGTNPGFDAPSDLDFVNLISKIPFRCQLGFYLNETTQICNWFVPQAHAFEAWGDLETRDRVASLVQPLILPLYNGRSMAEILSVILDGVKSKDGYALTRETWMSKTKLRDIEFESWWRQGLARGTVSLSRLADPGSQLQLGKSFSPNRSRPPKAENPGPTTGSSSYEVAFVPDATVWDGQFINNAWLQELPKPFTSLTWDNAALISPVTAEKLQLRTGDIVKLTLAERSIETPVLIIDGIANDVLCSVAWLRLNNKRDWARDRHEYQSSPHDPKLLVGR